MKIPEPLRISLLAFCERVMSERAPDVIIGTTDDPYVERWHLAARNDSENIYIHRIHRDDEDGALHDHRFANTSMILRTGYYEHFHHEPLNIVEGRYETFATLRLPGDVVERAADQPHRLCVIEDAEEPAVTMFVGGTKERDWGFVTPERWVPWREYLETKSKRLGNYDPEHT